MFFFQGAQGRPGVGLKGPQGEAGSRGLPGVKGEPGRAIEGPRGYPGDSAVCNTECESIGKSYHFMTLNLF